MADDFFASVLLNLSDCQKRENAALEVEGIVKQLARDKITELIKLLTNQLTSSADANHRKGGLSGLSAIMVGLSSIPVRAAPFGFEKIIPPVINSLSDQDSTVRKFAYEALYNIAAFVNGDLREIFKDFFDSLYELSEDSDVQSAAHLLDGLVKDIVKYDDKFSIEEFIRLLGKQMNVLNPNIRKVLLGLITYSVATLDIDVLHFLPYVLDGLFNMLSDSCHEVQLRAGEVLPILLQVIKDSPPVDYDRMTEILVQSAASADENTRLTAIAWIKEFVKLGGDRLVPLYAHILEAILPCIADKEEKIRVVARETNKEVRAVKTDHDKRFNVSSVLSMARRQLFSDGEATRIEALHWISALGKRHPKEVLLDDWDKVLRSLRDAVLEDPSDEVMLLALEVHSRVPENEDELFNLTKDLFGTFRHDNSVLEKRGELIIRRLCVLWDARKVYQNLSLKLAREPDLDFASIMVKGLHTILLTSSELSDLRSLLKQSSVNADAKDLLLSLCDSWCHSPMETISLCLFAQDYQHVSSVIQSLVKEDINDMFFIELDKLIHLLETPIFAHLRLQLLEPGKYVWLVTALYGLLMLLPQQSSAFKILLTRLKTSPSFGYLSKGLQIPEGVEMNEDSIIVLEGIKSPSRLQKFERMQQVHRMHSKSQAQALYNSASSSKEVDMSNPPSKRSRTGPNFADFECCEWDGYYGD